MRNPRNNPTDRILRLLSDYDDLKYAYEQAIILLAKHAPPGQITEHIPAVSHTAFETELVRQGGTYTRLRQAVLTQRGSMQRRRIRDADAMAEMTLDEVQKLIGDMK